MSARAHKLPSHLRFDHKSMGKEMRVKNVPFGSDKYDVLLAKYRFRRTQRLMAEVARMHRHLRKIRKEKKLLRKIIESGSRCQVCFKMRLETRCVAYIGDIPSGNAEVMCCSECADMCPRCHKFTSQGLCWGSSGDVCRGCYVGDNNECHSHARCGAADRKKG
jgi:hypothetical protein